MTTPSHNDLRERVARELLAILQADRLYPDGAWGQYDETTRALLLQNADRILAATQGGSPGSGAREALGHDWHYDTKPESGWCIKCGLYERDNPGEKCPGDGKAPEPPGEGSAPVPTAPAREDVEPSGTASLRGAARLEDLHNTAGWVAKCWREGKIHAKTPLARDFLLELETLAGLPAPEAKPEGPSPSSPPSPASQGAETVDERTLANCDGRIRIEIVGLRSKVETLEAALHDMAAYKTRLEAQVGSQLRAPVERAPEAPALAGKVMEVITRYEGGVLTAAQAMHEICESAPSPPLPAGEGSSPKSSPEAPPAGPAVDLEAIEACIDFAGNVQGNDDSMVRVARAAFARLRSPGGSAHG